MNRSYIAGGRNNMDNSIVSLSSLKDGPELLKNVPGRGGSPSLTLMQQHPPQASSLQATRASLQMTQATQASTAAQNSLFTPAKHQAQANAKQWLSDFDADMKKSKDGLNVEHVEQHVMEFRSRFNPQLFRLSSAINKGLK